MDCSACGFSKVVLDGKVSHGLLYKCASCNHVFTVVSNKKNKEYVEVYFDEHSNWFKYPNYKYYNFINTYIGTVFENRNFSLLDVGCGSGTFLKFIKEEILFN